MMINSATNSSHPLVGLTSSQQLTTFYVPSKIDYEFQHTCSTITIMNCIEQWKGHFETILVPHYNEAKHIWMDEKINVLQA
jgi:hypothetical protein